MQPVILLCIILKHAILLGVQEDLRLDLEFERKNEPQLQESTWENIKVDSGKIDQPQTNFSQ